MPFILSPCLRGLSLELSDSNPPPPPRPADIRPPLSVGEQLHRPAELPVLRAVPGVAQPTHGLHLRPVPGVRAAQAGRPGRRRSDRHVSSLTAGGDGGGGRLGEDGHVGKGWGAKWKAVGILRWDYQVIIRLQQSAVADFRGLLTDSAY